MRIAVVFDPDPSLGTDPRDLAEQPRRLGEFIDGNAVDVLLVWREYGDAFPGGSRSHVLSSGAWENLHGKQIRKVLTQLGSL